ncbi:MAG: GGDEF domain-containing protein [Thermaceae bacterium]
MPRVLVHLVGAYLLLEVFWSFHRGSTSLAPYWAGLVYLLVAFAFPFPKAVVWSALWLSLFLLGSLPWTDLYLGLHFLLSQVTLASMTLFLAQFWELYGQARFWEAEALTDPLTGLPNRRAFEMALEKEVARVERGAPPFSLILLDLDHFKALNDTYGHAYGDEALKRVARFLVGRVRRGDLVARWGGEEFALLLPATGGKEALEVAERLRKGLERLGFPASLGVGEYRGEEPLVFFQRVDQALYQAKRGGRNRVTVSDTPPP